MSALEEFGPVVGADWLAARLGDVVVADVRWYLDGRSGHDAYLGEHLPGAVWVDVDVDLSAEPSAAGGRHPLPDPDVFAERLGRLGIGDDDIVVAYDDQGGGFAARLVWLLRRIGQPAALLDGGLDGWTGARETGEVRRPPVTRTARPWPGDLLRTADEAQAAALAPDGVVLDARARGRYTGEVALPGEVRTGHVPGARSAPWSENLGADGLFLSPAALRDRYGALGIADGRDAIVYCGSGVTACHDLIALEHAGLPIAGLYAGSWSAWSVDLERPIASGASEDGSE